LKDHSRCLRSQACSIGRALPPGNRRSGLTAALDSLRAELQNAGVAAQLLADWPLRWILDQVDVDMQFVINVADIKKGRSRRGRKLALIDRLIKRREVTWSSRRWAPDYSLKPAP
jgi:hypothetical protein